MIDVDALLRELADDPSEYEREGSAAILVRQGKEYALSLKEVPGAGIAIEAESQGEKIGLSPILQFVQQHLLDLPRLASQIRRVFDKSSSNRPTHYIDGPATLSARAASVEWQATAQEFIALLNEQELGTTRLIQLMAGAGQGKTVLLEQIARQMASSYVPSPYPTPILLTVDLLGRYVGTVDDAIAGSLNNTYTFPRLTQRDVALCIRNRWLVLALDGFDELVARVGARDAFVRITELLEQLRASGTVILSARESFFELYKISAAIRSYLQPRVGSYDTAVVRLLPWSEEQGTKVFESLGSCNASKDLEQLLATFGDDRAIILQPFFLTRLAVLWAKGERFVDAGANQDQRWKTEYIIKTYIDRESEQKWIDREQRPLLSTAGHTALLAGIAEEMWRSGAFRLTGDEIKIAAQLALSGTDAPSAQIEQVAERAPTHCAFVANERGFSFIHDRFFHYYLSVRLKDLLLKSPAECARPLLEAKEFAPEVVGWVEWLLKTMRQEQVEAVRKLLEISEVAGKSGAASQNVASLLGVLLDNSTESWVIHDLAFSGDSLRQRGYKSIEFQNCLFNQVDLSGTRIHGCTLRECGFDEVRIDGGTDLSQSVFVDCTFRALESADASYSFDPREIEAKLKEHGAQIEDSEVEGARVAFSNRVNSETVSAIAKVVRQSERTCDVSVQEIEADFVSGRALIKAGIETGVLKEHRKNTSGARKDFVRFQVDRTLLLRGQVARTGNAPIDAFWDVLAERLPNRQ